VGGRGLHCRDRNRFENLEVPPALSRPQLCAGRVCAMVGPNGIQVDVLPDDTVRLREDVTFSVVDLCGVRLDIDVPKGFVCDGASIPRIFWSLVGHPLSGGPLRAAVIHDHLCVQASTRAERRFADTVFYWVLEQCCVPYWRRLALFLAVRAYATFVWRPKS